tara:strand:+ start:82 stop:234 length:153 start_codon:yes stop_codon:yes gene_type:complete
LTASKGIKKTKAVTGKQVNTANASVFALMYAIRTLAKEEIATEQTVAMAA